MAGDTNVFESKSWNHVDQRLRGRPSIVSFEELNVGDSLIRELAPYALKIRETAVIPTQQFFKYAAIVSSLGLRGTDSLACIIFDMEYTGHAIAYAGHFIVHKDFVFDPLTREPISSVVLSSLEQSVSHSPCKDCDHLSLFGTPNCNLLQFPDYFLNVSDKVYQNLLTETQEIFIAAIQSQQENHIVSKHHLSDQVTCSLRGPLTTDVYFKTALPINSNSLLRIIPKIQAMGTVKSSYGEFGSFESSIFSSVHCPLKVMDNVSDTYNAVDDVDDHTVYYCAYEEEGLMPFYFTTFLLGWLGGRCVVGVIVSDSFFIMATNRVYSRHSIPPVSPIDIPKLMGTDVMERIHLPCHISLEQVLTMLELRQILRHSCMYQNQMDVIIKSFGFSGTSGESGYQTLAPISRTFVRPPGPKTQGERLLKNWLQDMLDVHYTRTFQNSLCEYGDSPVDSRNPSLFCKNIIRLWIQELLRAIHKDQRPKDDCNLSQFFRMNIDEFVQKYQPLFGFSKGSRFTCHILGQDGLPMSVCGASVVTKDIGRHMEMQHTMPLWKQGSFLPFSLVLASKFVLLTNQADVTPLNQCKSMIADFHGTTYLELLRKVDAIHSSSPASQTRAKKRKRHSFEEILVRKVLQERLKKDERKISVLPDVTLVSSPARLNRSAIHPSI